MKKDGKLTEEINGHFEQFTRHELKKIKDKKGFIELFIDEKELNFSTAREISRDLLKEKNLGFKYLDGVFPNCSQDQEIIFGKYKKTFRLDMIIPDHDIVMIREAIRNNVHQVQDWLQECRDKARTESITLEI